jgi:peptidoglycan/LPS O-acetylase OafA/YrhL
VEDINGSKRRPDLDGLRGIAVLLTIFLHYVCRSGFFSYLGPRPIALLLDASWAGVDIFFVLSGFLIGGIILEHGHAANFLRVFYLRRALRILPVAFLTIAFSYLVLPLLNPSILWYSEVPPYTYPLFINNFWTSLGHRAYAPLGPMWSLAIEQQFYLLAPAFLLAAGARARNATLIALILVSPLLRLGGWRYSGWDFTPFRLDGFATGILLVVLLRDSRSCQFIFKHRRMVNCLVVCIVSTALLFTNCTRCSVLQHVAFGISLNSLAAGGVILCLQIDPGSRLSTALSPKWLTTVGKYSYFLYLMHMPILAYTMVAGIGGPEVLLLVVALAISFLGAWASWRFIESRLIGLGRNYAYQSPLAGGRRFSLPAASPMPLPPRRSPTSATSSR